MKKVICLFMLLVLSGCGDKPVEPLVFGAIAWPGYEPAYVARELGFLDERRIHLAEFTNSTEVLRALRNGRLHIAGLTLDEALGLRQSVPDLRIFMAVDVSNGADVLMARRGINNLGQLKGKRIGVEKTALGAYFLSLILRAAHLSASEVHIVSLPLDEQVQSYRAGMLDAVVTFGLVRGQLTKLGAVALFDSTKVPGKIVDTLVVREADASRHRQHLLAFTKAWFRALRVIQSEPARVYPMMARHERVSVEELEETTHGLELLDQRGNMRQFTGNPPELLRTSMEIQRIMNESGLAVGSDDLTSLIDSSIVAESGID